MEAAPATEPEPEAPSMPTSSEAASMPPPPKPQSRRERSATVNGCTHENCAMVPSSAFWEANRIIGPNGLAHLVVGATEADLVPECQTDDSLPRTKRKRRSSSIREEDKENTSPHRAKGVQEVEAVQQTPKRPRHSWAGD